MSYQRIREAQVGVSGVHVTPFDASGRVNGAMLERIVDGLAKSGIDNIVTGGNTAEFYALTMDEVREVHRIAISTTAGRSTVTAAVGRALRDAQHLAENAASLGADALMIHQVNDPFASTGGIVAYTHAIADTTSLPVVLYLRQDSFASNELLDLIAHPRVVAIKYAVPDPLRLAERLRLTAKRDLLWVCGLAEAWALPFASVGASGFTSGLVNVHPTLSIAIRNALVARDFFAARELVERIAPFEALRAREGNGDNVTVVKEAMRMLGFQVGPVRPPGTPELGAAGRTELVAILRSWGLSVQ